MTITHLLICTRCNATVGFLYYEEKFTPDLEHVNELFCMKCHKLKMVADFGLDKYHGR